jgi:hypothetical protein
MRRQCNSGKTMSNVNSSADYEHYRVVDTYRRSISGLKQCTISEVTIAHHPYDFGEGDYHLKSWIYQQTRSHHQTSCLQQWRAED